VKKNEACNLFPSTSQASTLRQTPTKQKHEVTIECSILYR